MVGQKNCTPILFILLALIAKTFNKYVIKQWFYWYFKIIMNNNTLIELFLLL